MLLSVQKPLADRPGILNNQPTKQPIKPPKDMINREEILSGFDRIAKQRFGEQAAARWSANDSNVVEICTGQLSADANDINRFNTACNYKCWVTTNAKHEIIICREV